MLNKIIGATLLIAGMTVGAGMLVLPVTTGIYGFQSTLSIFLVTWAMMTFSGYLILEVSMWMPLHSHLTTMLKRTLSAPVMVIAWACYLILLFGLLTIYIEGMSGILHDFLQEILHAQFAIWIIIFILSISIGLIVSMGAKIVEPFNRFLIIFMFLAFISLIAVLAPHVIVGKIHYSYTSHVWFELPIVVAAFGYHFIIPSLRDYLQGNLKALRISIFIGSLIPLVMYLIWQFVILGIVPVSGSHGLLALFSAKANADTLAIVISHILKNKAYLMGFEFFSFFAMATSALIVGLTLFDFVGDTLTVKKEKWNKWIIAVIVCLPPFLFVTEFPNLFTQILEYSGMLMAILLVFLPVLMVWRGRYYVYMSSQYRVVGGKLALMFPLIFAVVVVVIRIYFL